MLNQAQRNRIDVVLVSPRNPLNIGAVARAMANFGFTRLTVVAPFQEHWREARSAVGAPAVLAEARETATLAEALAECTLAVGTGTVSARRPEQPVAALPHLAPIVEIELRNGGRVAIVFGPEKRGLTREDLARCHLLAEIPTDAAQPSMNLGQAAAVCLYELAARVSLSEGNPAEAKPAGDKHYGVSRFPGRSGSDRFDPSRSEGERVLAPAETSAARGAEIDMLAEVIAGTMEAARYSPRAMREANRHDVHLLLRRLNLTSSDVKRALGLFRRVLWGLKRQP